MKNQTVIEIRDAVRDKKITAVEVVKDCLAKIKKGDKKIGAFLEVYEKEALAAAKKIDKMDKKDLPRLAGVRTTP